MSSQELELVPRPRVNGQHYSAAEIEAQAVEALKLKVLGWSDTEIAEKLRLARQTVQKRVAYGVQQHGQATVAEFREIAKQRYEKGLEALSVRVEEGDTEAIRLWFDGTAKYARLVGAEAPPQVEMHVTVETEQERGLREMLAQAERDEKARETVIVEGEVVSVVRADETQGDTDDRGHMPTR